MSLFKRPLAAVRIALRIASRIGAIALVLFCWSNPAKAHEGHDHGAPAPTLPSSVKPRVTIETELYQLVAIAAGAQLTVFLDRYGTNEPVTDAGIDLLLGSETIAMTRRADGSYAANVPAVASTGRFDLVFNVTSPGGNDLLAGTLDVAPQSSAAQGVGVNSVALAGRGVVQLGIALIAGVGIGFAFRSRSTPAIAIAAALCVVLVATAALAHDGHAPSPIPDGTSLTGDVPRRLADGSIFLPKPSQRLLTIRSQIVSETDANRGIALVGRVISDPNRSGIVQSIAGGRINAASGGLPRLGQAVKRGDVLATVEPALPLADQSTLAEKQRELEGAILLAKQKLARLDRLGANVTPRSNIEDTDLEIRNLELRLAGLKAAKLQPETLIAPIDGIISTSHVVAGQVVGAQDVLYRIVDPAGLWVEALVFDQLDPDAIVKAAAKLPNGTVLQLVYRGRGRALLAQATQIQFAIEEPPTGVLVGQPLTVIARTGEAVRGILLPRDAVLRGAAGEAIVWQQIEPERFVAQPVRVEPFDGGAVLITGGIAAKDRVVVHGAELLAQVR